MMAKINIIFLSFEIQFSVQRRSSGTVIGLKTSGCPVWRRGRAAISLILLPEEGKADREPTAGGEWHRAAREGSDKALGKNLLSIRVVTSTRTGFLER